MNKDFSLLITSLRESSFVRNSKKLMDKQIDELRHSKKWKQLYDTYLRKLILETPIVIHKLDFFGEVQGYNDIAGRYLFNKITENVVREKMKKTAYAANPPDFYM